MAGHDPELLSHLKEKAVILKDEGLNCC